jgi:putative addiction module component (TIGR02574 family)
MTAAELANQIMALPAADRAAIAQKVWESIEDEHVPISPESDAEAIALARQRDAELSAGKVQERSHEDTMKNARRSIECD